MAKNPINYNLSCRQSLIVIEAFQQMFCMGKYGKIWANVSVAESRGHLGIPEPAKVTPPPQPLQSKNRYSKVGNLVVGIWDVQLFKNKEQEICVKDLSLTLHHFHIELTTFYLRIKCKSGKTIKVKQHLELLHKFHCWKEKDTQICK